jgi:hypothetical protein
MQKLLVTIENWAVVQSVISTTYEDLEPGNHLTGNVFGHANLPDAVFVYSSAILRVDHGDHWVETLNTLYRLGKASDAYKSWKAEREEEAVA